jgi:hypothetical protein
MRFFTPETVKMSDFENSGLGFQQLQVNNENEPAAPTKKLNLHTGSLSKF